jgi:hypothetical protein
VNAKRMRQWIDRFGAYRSAVTNLTIESWIEQFDDADKDLAARVLDVVEFYGQAHIHAAYRQALNALPGWHTTKSRRTGEWRFAAMSGSAGESGDGMLYQFRVANNLDGARFNDLFVARRDLVGQKLGPDDIVVLLDDFSGTGKQVCDAWSNPQTAFSELLAGVGRVYLVLVAVTKHAKRKIGAETSLTVLPAHDLDDGDNIFSDDCKHFTAQDRKRLFQYCKVASLAAPRGFGDCGLVVVFQHRTPNNTIPILHADHADWSGLFPRHD